MLKKYLREKLKYILWMLTVSVVFAAVWLLSGNDARNGVYCVFLVLFISAAFFMLDYVRIMRQHKLLSTIIEALDDFEENFPDVSGVLAGDYREIASACRENLKKCSNDAKRAQNDAIEYFTMWVHQIKTPVSALHLLLSSNNIDSIRCEQELFKIERYVDMALKYVKTSDMADDLVFAKCDADDVIRESVKKYAVLFIGKKLSVTVNETHIQFITDEKWFAFIIEQLISNAVKYTKTGGVTINGGERVITISDTGEGIRAEDLPRVFQKGYTGYNGRMDKRASGIGLYLTKKVARTLGIGVSLEQREGGGTKAVLTLPNKPHGMYE